MLHMERILPDLINKADNFGYYPLHYCLAYLLRPSSRYIEPTDKPAVELINYMLSQGADSTIVDESGNSLLHYLACGLNRRDIRTSKEVVRGIFARLARSGQDVNARNKAGWTPAHFLVAYETRGPADEGLGSVLETLDELGVDWQAKDDMGRTVLHLAGESGAWLFKKLVERGLDPWLEDAEGRTSLDMAAVYGNKRVLSMFGDSKDEE
jgi:ankyrin repeat protein